ncbi:patatin-like phospholipase domain-containing protein 4 isoform X6 [Molossus molossus]|uniref:Patatin like phospholipase domain containing 4 n=1 Tax=Molossus molossus TaxID=27622 RepID=A0A7J8J7J7_MOLMO|nr:patatin-like phospholipase domain-containing protein 4 isoform X6 [Molossus molossus]KAF6492803.1 patatin like phospholipase domain containing 4 [Molossus molossus]
MKGINLSFSACGFLGIYHLGAASALCRHGQKLLKDVQAFAGASAGSLVASVLLTAPEKLEVLCASSFVPIYAGLRAVEYRGQPSSPLGFPTAPSGVRAQPRVHAPPHTLLHRDQALLCAYRWKIFWMGDRKEEPVPFETTWRDLEGITLSEKWVDGGLTDSLPILPGGRTVTVSPFTGRLDISPQDDGRLGSYVRVANQDVLVSHHVPGCLKGVRLLRCPTHLQNGGSSLITFVHTTSFIYGTCLALVPPDGECEVACSSVMVCAEASSVSFFLF